MTNTNVRCLRWIGLLKGAAAFAICSLLVVGSLVADNPETKSGKANRSVDSMPRAKILKMSQKIDALIEKQLDSKQLNFNKKASDEIFLRRAYLDITGRIPTIEEAQKFLNSKNQSKRADLVDQLLGSYGYVSRQYNFFADLLRVKSRVRNVLGQPYIDFIKDSLEQNKPYDQFVRDLLSSSGPMMEEGNGAVGYYLRDVNMPEDNMSNTVRIFLGTRLECAQCHDHPFDKWTQRQYYEMVAFTGGMGYRLNEPDSNHAKDIKQLRGKIDDDRLKPIIRKIVEPMLYGIRGNGTGLARLPENYLGSQGDEFDIIKGKTMFGGETLVDAAIPTRNKKINKRNIQLIAGAKQLNSREAYAQWMTEADNPRFAKVIANRLWKQAMGLALIEPIDVIEDSTKASNPELMKYLSEIMVELDFDMKQYLRVVYNTRAYNAEAFGDDVVNPAEYYFGGPVMRRMAAEQIWDSLLTMTFADIDKRSNGVRSSYNRVYTAGDDMYEAYENLQEMSGDDVLELANTVLSKGRRAAMKDMMSSKPAVSKVEQKKLEQQKERLKKQMAAARKAKNTKKQKELMLKKNELMSKYRRKSGNDRFLRASELISPAPPGHFLREFGQSDRETIENSNTDPAVTQVLSLMNGYIESQIARNSSTLLMKNVFEAKQDEKIDAVFLTMLSRRATASEKSNWSREFRKNPKDGHEVMADLVWILANSNEFIFVK